ncbi:ribose 5-phosphate isomerase B [Candidatus Paracaedibacter symbiosus]|uniref:ribose 5-phosphate isomerase B n=1 Tax=Candidatus Paracaedibacter symbiosus TaxID=244582 RepID=UPI0005097CA3|nr:ribose 5-phosphate isomerase B [Candidatus Paracaedibacter symbiosus]
MSVKKLAIASDHAGFSLKQVLIDLAKNMGFMVEDLGVDEKTASVDYPDYGIKAIKSVLAGESTFAVLLCGTGIGMSILANRFPEIRAAVCHTEFEAEVARKHNNANVLCLGGRVIGEEIATRCLKVFLETEFEAGRHQRRLDKLAKLYQTHQ